MRLIVTLDDYGGMLFNRRRQSRDRVLTEDILRTVGEGRLVVSPYTAPLFPSCTALTVAEDPLSVAGKGDFCFLEERSPRGQMHLFSTVVIYRWNRHYPADVFFDADLTEFSLIEAEELEGFSHKIITKEVYQRL
ncbi:MAG: ribonuclease Z [Clostridia bacterium]|nr:ribonuclease Z [Clostridia bacterium]